MAGPYHDCGVIFDMDGVLVDTGAAHYESWQVIAKRWGVPITLQAFHDTFGRPNHQIIPLLLQRQVSDAELREVDRVKEEAFRQIIGQSIRPLPGVVVLVEGLRRDGFALAVGSSAPRENIDLVLSALGIAAHFGGIVSGWDVESGKPAPDVFLKAAQFIECRPERCLVIEDVPAGIAAAHAAGMRCMAVTTTHPAAALSEADRVVDTLESVGVAEIARMLGVAQTA